VTGPCRWNGTRADYLSPGNRALDVFLSLITDCRIFEAKTALRSSSNLQRPGFSGLSPDAHRLVRTPRVCVQYRETSLNFLSRLMEEEGLFYFFEHTSQKHTLSLRILIPFAPCPDNASVRYGVTPAGGHEEDLVHAISSEHSVRSQCISLTDYDFQKPKVKLDVRPPQPATISSTTRASTFRENWASGSPNPARGAEPNG